MCVQVRATCAQVEALAHHHRMAYVATTLGYVAQRLMTTSDTVTFTEGGGSSAPATLTRYFCVEIDDPYVKRDLFT